MYNLRYHIASLVAVFLALAVGLLLGSMVAERGMITEQTASLIDDLEQRFDEISATNDQLSIGLERDHAFAQAAVAPLTADALIGTHVLVLASPQAIDSVNAVNETVTTAGGTVVNATIITPALGLDKEEPEGLAGYFQLQGVEMEEPGEALQRQVAAALVDEWRAGTSSLTALLVGDGLLTVESSSATATIDAIVVVGTAEAGCDPIGLEAARAMDGAGGVGIGADSAAVEGGIASICSAQGLSAIDHVTTPQGRVSLVWLLSRRAEGYYGFGQGAQGYVPPLGP